MQPFMQENVIPNELHNSVCETSKTSRRERKRRNWILEGVPLRRSERIRQRIQRKNLEKTETTTNTEKVKKSAVQRKKRLYTRKNLPKNLLANTSIMNQIARFLDDSQTHSQSNEDCSDIRIAEKVVGQCTRNGTRFILVKWKNIDTPEYLEKKKAPDDILQLFNAYLDEERNELNDEPGIESIMFRKPKIEQPSEIDYRWEQQQTGEEILAASPETNNCLHVKLE
ncbi:hypothetical protein JTE90_007239 [Oedothorax gibbosus]|uniref:Chromo domain-containing protein n=1 Tax=Oedothorax gibbosus TaxID=931172 RepID=A0AAV6VPQ2_9ARAC|nr:hypothetical protein JTE90_007239 [Oedothorax gibbosus]